MRGERLHLILLGVLYSFSVPVSGWLLIPSYLAVGSFYRGNSEKPTVAMAPPEFVPDLEPFPQFDEDLEGFGADDFTETSSEVQGFDPSKWDLTWDENVPDFQSVTLVGRVGGVPERKVLPDGNAVVTANIACQRRIHPAERETENIAYGEEGTDWYTLELWGNDAEFVSKFVEKGARVGVVGKLKIDEWRDKSSGEKRETAKIVVNQFELLETRAEAALRKSKPQNSNKDPFFG
eukprot:Nitzschia sp. Nitz4//scaffold4_size323378//204963//205667//NITZ4_000677-RA/size323378-processed-gene-0.365-mRNA-1//-1//CDS//3329553450//7110//frame0